MKKKVGIFIFVSLLIVGVLYMYTNNVYQVWVQSSAISPLDTSYISCKSDIFTSENGEKKYAIYLTSSKKTYTYKYTLNNNRITRDRISLFSIQRVDISHAVNLQFLKNQKIALGQTNTEYQEYTFSYGANNITLHPSIYLNGQKMSCPDIKLSDRGETQLCGDMLTEEAPVIPEGNLQCIGNYAFKIIRKNQPTSSGLLSSFFGTNEPLATPLTTETLYTAPNTTEQKCNNGLDINTYPNCVCPKGYKIESKDGKTDCYPTFFKRFIDGVGFGGFTVYEDIGNGKGEGGFGITGEVTS